MVSIPTPKSIIDTAIIPAYALLPPSMHSPLATLQLLANGCQETKFLARRQAGNGPARGFWQFERGGGVVGVLTHPATSAAAVHVCDAREVAATATDVYNSLEHDDVLAAAFARLLLWADPHKLPARGDQQGAWGAYLSAWRPGHPRPDDWPESYRWALSAPESSL